MSRDELKEELVRFLRTIQRPDRPIEIVIDEHTSLVDSGLIDSLAVMKIIDYLEEVHGLDFAGTGLDPEDLSSIAGILDLIQRRKAG